MRAQTLRRRPTQQARSPLNKMRWALFSMLILASLFAYNDAYKKPIWLDLLKPKVHDTVISQLAQPASSLPKAAKLKPKREVWTHDIPFADDSLTDFSPFVAGFHDADFFGKGKLVALNDQFDLPSEEMSGFLQVNRIQGINQLVLTDMARNQYFALVDSSGADAANAGGGSGGASGGGASNGGVGGGGNNMVIDKKTQDNGGNGTLPALIVAENLEQNGNIDSLTSAVPLPAAMWLFASALVGLFGARRKFNKLD